MRKKNVYIFILCIIFVSCKKSKPVLNNNENITLEDNSKTEIKIPENNDVIVQETENYFNFSEPESVKISDIIFEKSLHKDFPEIFNYDSIPKYEMDISGLNNEQIDFYKKYVGSYFYKTSLDPLFLSRHVYNMEINRIINNIKYYSFYRSFNGITYYETDDDIPFAMCDSYAIWQLKSYDFETDLVKIDSNSFFEDVIEKKRKESSSVRNIEYNEEEVKLLIGNAIESCNNYFDDEEILKYFDVDSFKIINKNNQAEKVSETEICRLLQQLSFMLKMIDGKFELYSNVYFSEDFNLVNNIFGECIIIEFKCKSLDYYGSLIIKKTNDGYKIVSIRVDFDLV